MTNDYDRISGILLHPTSLPSPYGIGDLGRGAYEFIDFLKKSGQHIWQTLPLTPTGFGDSPYQSFSAFAGQPLLISPEHLESLGLTDGHPLSCHPVSTQDHVDYEQIIPWKEQLLRNAYRIFSQGDFPALRTEFLQFCRQEHTWLNDYALFMACKAIHHGADWLSWKEPYRSPDQDAKQHLYAELRDEADYHSFVQFLFFSEWTQLKEYANQNDVLIIGDMPIFVSLDSADVWSHRELFALDPDGYPTQVAGVPPDYFSATGQLWGNPLYDWQAHKKDGYSWWIERMRMQLRISDYVRIDHFRGFESYWSVPSGEETAVRGTWMPGPGKDLFYALKQALGEDLPIIAEDLGTITPEVEALRDHFSFPGMKILQFAFDGEEESTYLPHRLTTTNCVCYTGTHDNNTTKGWYDTASEYSRDKVRRYMNTDGGRISRDFIRTALGSIASFAIFPMQDVLDIGSEGRMNTPGSPFGNWSWRYDGSCLSDALAHQLLTITRLYGRGIKKEDKP